jgi:hypothetical protein
LPSATHAAVGRSFRKIRLPALKLLSPLLSLQPFLHLAQIALTAGRLGREGALIRIKLARGLADGNPFAGRPSIFDRPPPTFRPVLLHIDLPCSAKSCQEPRNQRRDISHYIDPPVTRNAAREVKFVRPVTESPNYAPAICRMAVETSGRSDARDDRE